MPKDLNPTIDHVVNSAAKSTVDFTGQNVGDPDSTLPHSPTKSPDSGRVPAIPGYDVLGEIARGGMGVVLEARDVALDREVAIKLLLPGSNLALATERFLREAKLAARLPHPAIPPVHALGSLPDGSPFLAMKLIRGQTLAKILQTTPGIGLPRHLQIFEQIAQAVGFAHTQGIIHRDLKPLNVMVGAFGEVQVMDWGLAKSLQGESDRVGEELRSDSPADSSSTQAGAIMGTAAYMSPEQARGEVVDARTDVFALGAILYEMLTGERPWGSGSTAELLGRAQRASLESCFERLAGCHADGELVALARRALAPGADERFATGQAVAEAVAGYRSGVENRLRQAESDRAAAEVRAAEQGQKRRLMQIAGGIIAAVLLIGITGTTLGWFEARKQTHLAKQETIQKELARQGEAARAAAEKLANEQTKKGNGIILDIFDDLDIGQIKHGRDPLEDVLAKRLVKAADQLEGTTLGDPVTVARLQNQLGFSLLSLGYPDAAIPLFQKARATWSVELGPYHRDTLESMYNLALGFKDAGKLDLAMPLLEETLKLRKSKLGPNDPDTLSSMNSLALGYQAAGKLERAQSLFEETVPLMKAKHGPDNPHTLTTMGNLALVYQATGKLDLALPLLERTLELKKAQHGPNHTVTLTGMASLALGYRAAGKMELSLPLLEEALKVSKTHLGIDHPDTLHAMSNLALGYQVAGKLNLALPLLAETLPLTKAKLGPDHPDTFAIMNNLAAIYLDTGRPDLALPLSEESLRLMKAKLGPTHPSTLTSMVTLAAGYRAAKKLDLAVPLLEETLKLSKEHLGPDHPDTLHSMSFLALGYQDSGKLDLALPLFEETLKLRKAQLGPSHPDTLASMNNLASGYQAAKKLDLALPLLEETLRQMKAKLGPDHPATLTGMNNLSAGYFAAGKLDLALPLLKDTLDIMKVKFGPDHPSTLSMMANLATFYKTAKKLDLALPLYEEMLKIRKAKLGPDHLDTLKSANSLALAYLESQRSEEALPLFEDYVQGMRKQSKGSDPGFASQLAVFSQELLKFGLFVPAEPYLRECLTIREAAQPDEWTTFNTKSLLGGTLLGQKKFAEAEPLLLAGCEGMMQRKDLIPPAGKIRLPDALDRLIELYTATDKPEEAKRWQAERAKHPPLAIPANQKK